MACFACQSRSGAHVNTTLPLLDASAPRPPPAAVWGAPSSACAPSCRPRASFCSSPCPSRSPRR
eukprot:2038095-Pyramimonas_sp.AAC.1